MTADLHDTLTETCDRVADRFGIAWRRPVEPIIVPVAVLEFDGSTYRFHYVAGAATTPGFRSLPGFPELHRVYSAQDLFPFFEHRAIDPRRPDYEVFLESLDLAPGAPVLDVLARSGGRRVGDKLQMQREPSVSADGTTSCTFLVHGLRYMDADRAIDALSPGDRLDLRPDADNPVNPDALFVTTGAGTPVGWVPDLLVDYAHVVRAYGPVTVRVVRVNSPHLPDHVRLRVRLDGHVAPGYRPFAGPDWQPLSHV